MGYLKELLPQMYRYRLAKNGLAHPGTPINLTFSVTNVCQSRCKTCRIWELYKKHPEKRFEELKIDEIEAIFKSMGHVYIFNVSGGEPFLRPDFNRIIELAADCLTPGIIHIPTNAIAADMVERKTATIIRFLKRFHPDIKLTVKPSLDHIGEKHDDIRGIPGNFRKVMKLYERLKTYQSEYPNLHVELGTVISRWNVSDIEEIAEYVTGLGVDSYRNEIAEQRSEMFNTDSAVTPDVRDYERAVSFFVSRIRKNMANRTFFHRITNAFRIVYYDLAVRIMRENRQVIPCYAGVSNAHMTPYGDIWPCCTLGYEKSMGNLRDADYNFKRIWNSRHAEDIRRYIHEGRCACPLANQTYSNMLMNMPSMMKVFREMATDGKRPGK